VLSVPRAVLRRTTAAGVDCLDLPAQSGPLAAITVRRIGRHRQAPGPVVPLLTPTIEDHFDAGPARPFEPLEQFVLSGGHDYDVCHHRLR
jgi:hypothetical protein